MPANVKPTPGAYDPVHDAMDAGGWSYDSTKPVNPSGASGGVNTGYHPTTQTDKLIVHYNTVEGVTGNPPSETLEAYSGESKSVTLKATVKENEYGMKKGTGYYFIGWSLNSPSGTLSHKPGDIVTNTWSQYSSGTVTKNMYPVFVNSNAYIYMPDNNTNEKYSRFTSKESGVSTNLAGAIFTRKGYTQTGWSASKGGSKVYDIGASVTPATNNIEVLYPFWSANTYHITLHGNGSMQTDQVLTVEYDSEVFIPADSSDIIIPLSSVVIDANDRIVLNADTDWYKNSDDLIVTHAIAFYRPGYHIDHWNESIDGEGSRWAAGTTYKFTREEDVELYAIWVGAKYKVYYRDEDSKPRSYVHTSVATYGEPFYTDRVPYPADKEYYTFAGWEDSSGIMLEKANKWFDAYTFNVENPIWYFTEDIVLTRKWSPFYPFGRIFFGDKYSDECGIYVEKPPSFKWPEYNYQHDKVVGRNGDMLRDLGNYSNVSAEYNITAYDGNDYKSVAKKVSAWLHRETNGEYLRLEDSYEPDIYRLAVYEESNELENILSKAGKCKITFNCKPQKFLLSGDVPITITKSSATITNPTNHSSSPIIEIYGTGSIFINGVEIKVLQNYNHIVLDSENYKAVSASGGNMNGYMYCNDSIFLKPGKNTITKRSGIEKLIITPRWWRV